MVLTVTALVACGITNGKPSVSAPSGISDPSALSDKEERSSSGCGNCLSMRQLNEEYEANSFATQQKYRGTRHNFEGTVESIDQEPSVPPKPLIRARSGGETITFSFGWDEDYSWVLALSKGDWVKVNCPDTQCRQPLGTQRYGYPLSGRVRQS